MLTPQLPARVPPAACAAPSVEAAFAATPGESWRRVGAGGYVRDAAGRWPIVALHERRSRAGRLTAVRFTLRGQAVRASRAPPTTTSADVAPPADALVRWYAWVDDEPSARTLTALPHDTARVIAERIARSDACA